MVDNDVRIPDTTFELLTQTHVLEFKSSIVTAFQYQGERKIINGFQQKCGFLVVKSTFPNTMVVHSLLFCFGFSKSWSFRQQHNKLSTMETVKFFE